MDKIEEKIEKSKQLPQEIKDRIDEIFFYNNVIATIIMFFFAVINYSYYKFPTNEFMNVSKVMALGMAIVSILVFETSYRKENLKITLYAVECLFCAILTAFIPYVYIYSEDIYRGFIMTLPLVFAAYYVLKTIVSYIRKWTKYRRETITDIKEILDDSKEFTSYIDDDSSSKLLKEQKELEDKIAEEKKKIKELEKKRKELEKQNNKKENSKKENTKDNKKNEKKETNNKSKVEEKKESTKKRVVKKSKKENKK